MSTLGFATASSAGTELERVRRLAADTVRTLAMGAVQKANSGHPGMPMGPYAARLSPKPLGEC